mgnify:CR=1 FL=1
MPDRSSCEPLFLTPFTAPRPPANPLIFVVDDDEAIRDSLAMLLETAGYQVSTYASAPEFLNHANQEAVGCVLVDIRMPEMNGLDLLKEMRQKASPLPVIMITGHGDVALAVAALKGGAVDFLEKPFDPERLLESVGEAVAQRNFTHRQQIEVREILARMSLLTPREREVLDLVAAGLANKVVANRLNISSRTVEIHRARVMEKMAARHVSDLVRMSLRVASSGLPIPSASGENEGAG